VNPRVGLPHEPGYNNKCPFCQFEFPTDPRMPPPILYYSKDKELQKQYDKLYETEKQTLQQIDIAALEKQGQSIDKESFERLLKITNGHFWIPKEPIKAVAVGMATLEGLTTLNPEPFDGFGSIINELIDKLNSFSPGVDDAEIAIAYGPLSTAMNITKTNLETYFNRKVESTKLPSVISFFNRLWESPPQTLGELLRTFLLLPLQRASINNFDGSFLFTSLTPRNAVYKDIGSEDIKKLEGYMKDHMNQVPEIIKIINASSQPEKVKRAIDTLCNKLNQVIPTLINVLRTNVVPYGRIGFPYIQRAILTGMLWEFVDINGDGSRTDTGKILVACMVKAYERDENTLKTPEEIRKLITSRNETEKVEIINELDKMTPEQKRAELAMKALGLGRWARGASKGIFSYDEEQQAFEAAERERRGIVDFYGGQEGTGDGYDNYAEDGDES
jgi:hypothetical protein